ncbi:hypothetical protein HRG_004114 [Hirsutella rhossiliensis]|uniref:Fungal N-terminal domain-containing protein n=1 Tax=Hirsutella rhossiliensis TaxID=111463 RepID=A0A9P8N0W4_9HYPO|nr:uncharacterized protein HRG_04114 [Hirsutella rhossiliensis]KAH0966098.1 hypothetical protein HRG_04114 [Hirsutella rhossiliensis]
MSGLEVVGLVVGILPLAVKALKGYRTILSGVRNVDRDLNALIRDIETEHVRLRATCEILLDGVAPSLVMDKMIQAPFGPAWKPYNDQLRLRLWTECGQFEELVAEMWKTAQGLEAKLGIEEDGKTRLTDRVAILRELQRRTIFTLKKKDFEETISRFKTANSVLYELAGRNCGLEPTRRRRSQARVIKLVRGLTLGIFNALRSAKTCRCADSHNVGLELAPRNVVLVPSDDDDQVAKKFNFHVGVTDTQKTAPSYWQSLLVRPAGFEGQLAYAVELQACQRSIDVSNANTS